MANTFIDLRANKNLIALDIRKAMTPVIHDFTDSIAILSHVNAELRKNYERQN